jgi:hypothetical protein
VKNITLPVAFFNAVLEVYIKWIDHPDCLPVKYPDINQDLELIYAMMREKLDAIEKRADYIKQGGKFSD